MRVFNYSFIFVLLIFTQIYLQEISFNDYVTGPNNPTLNQEFLRRDLTELSKNNKGWVEALVSDEKQKKRWKS